LTKPQTKQETSNVSKTLEELGRIIKDNYDMRDILASYPLKYPNDLAEIGKFALKYGDINENGELK
jgi:hypothetical protein